MLDDNELFDRVFEEGRRAARIGHTVTMNPYLDLDSIELPAWVEGFASVNTAILIPSERARIYHQGQTAAASGQLATTCPYIDEENPQRMEIWLLGYSPHVEEQLTADDVQAL